MLPALSPCSTIACCTRWRLPSSTLTFSALHQHLGLIAALPLQPGQLLLWQNSYVVNRAACCSCGWQHACTAMMCAVGGSTHPESADMSMHFTRLQAPLPCGCCLIALSAGAVGVDASTSSFPVHAMISSKVPHELAAQLVAEIAGTGPKMAVSTVASSPGCCVFQATLTESVAPWCDAAAVLTQPRGICSCC